MNDPRNTGIEELYGSVFFLLLLFIFIIFLKIFIRIATSQAGLLMSRGVGLCKNALQAIATAGSYFYFIFPAGYPAFLNSSA